MYPSTTELIFRKSSYSNPQNCVEVADLRGGTAIRDSQHPGQGHLTIPGREWSAFLAAIREDAI